MHDVAFPTRKTDGARRVDQELTTVLEHMTASREPITVRSVVRRMSTLSQPSSITRDIWRMGRITTAEHERIRMLAESSAPVGEVPKKPFRGAEIVPDIRHLLSFVCIASVGNLGYAARELQVSQPTLSRQLQALEEAFGMKLLIRHGRGVTLTLAGLRLLRRLETALPRLTTSLACGAHAYPDTEALSSPGNGIVSLGMVPGIGGPIMSRIVPRIRSRWPKVLLRVDEGSSAALIERVLGRQLDFAVLQDPPSLETLYTYRVSTDRFGLVASASTAVGSDSSPVRLQDLASLPLVLPGAKDNIRRRLEKACFQHGIRLRPFVETESVELAKTIVRRGLGFTVLPGLMAQEEVGLGRLIFRVVEQPTITTVHAVCASRDNQSSFVAEFSAIVRDVMVSLVGNGEQGRALKIG